LTRMAGSVTIANLSDIHCGDPHFVPDLMERAISEINGLEPDIVVCSGDLTTFGFKEEFAEAKRYLDRIQCTSFVVVPGNHDSRNVGYVHFEELYGDRNSVLRKNGVAVVAVDSTEPDLDHGQIGRGRYTWIEEQFSQPADLKIFVMHHHLLPVPGTGRERNIVYDAGDALECLQRADVDLVLCGHKHVPYAWRLENLFIVNAGTVSTLRLRGHTRPCYHVRGGEDYGVPLVSSLDDVDADVVVDLSDEPVLGPAARFRVAAEALALGRAYVGADFRFDPPPFEPFELPSLAVFGTGKRVGKTA